MTDSYSLVEAGIMDRLRSALKDPYFYKPGTNTLESWRVSDNDSNLFLGGDYFIVLRPGSFTDVSAQYKSGEIQNVDWDTQIRLYVRYQERADQWSLLKPFRGAIIEAVMKYRFLGAVTINGDSIAEVPAVDRVRSIRPTEPAGYFWMFGNAREAGNPPNFMYQPLQVTTRQRVRYD